MEFTTFYDENETINSTVNVTNNKTSFMETFNTTTCTQDITAANVLLLLEEDPGLATANNLYECFQKSVKDKCVKHQIFSLLNDFNNLCNEQVNFLRKLLVNSVPLQQRNVSKTHETLNILHDEENTWRLISSLYKDRLEAESSQEYSMIAKIGKYQSEKDFVSELYGRDTCLRQAQIVIDWLEKSAEINLMYFRDKIDYFLDKSGAWENTLHSLKFNEGSNKRLESKMVSKIDPDAPIRQNKSLADLDQEDEVRLLRYLFLFIRAGKLTEAQQLCQKCGQSWRAATLEGWRLSNDPNFSPLNDTGKISSIEGNPHRDIWKAVCWRMSNDNRLHSYERALYSSLCGNLNELLPMCVTWQDYVWAYFKVFVDVHVEHEIRLNFTTNHTYQSLPPNYWDKMYAADTIFKKIESSPSEKIKSESKDKFRLIQKYIILNDTDTLVEEMFDWCKDKDNTVDFHLLRFMAHLILFFQSVDICSKEELCTSIIEAYIRELINRHEIKIVATYVSKLPQDLQVEWYARFLETITDPKERELTLSLGNEACLDIPSITKLVVENVCNKDLTQVALSIDQTLHEMTTTDDDKQKIDALTWLMYDPMQRGEALHQANSIMRSFIACKKLYATREVFNKIPSDTIDLISRNWQSQMGESELCCEYENAIREYLCVSAYLSAHESFNDWFEHFHNSKPVKPEFQPTTNFKDKVTHEHKQKQYESEFSRWKQSLDVQTKYTTERIYNVLLFVDGGWMVDERSEEAELDESRAQQMKLLRRLCLPGLCFLLHQVLNSSNRYKECLHLANIVTSEQYKLYKEFTKEELQNLLNKLCDLSVNLLNSGSDPLGYDIV